MKISIVIPVWRDLDKKFTELCVNSIRKNSKESHEIILAVNPGTDIEAYKHIPADIIFGSDLQGQCHANNEAVKRASCEWVMVADNDNVFPPNWEKGLEYLKPDLVLTLNSMEWNSRGVLPGAVIYNCGALNDFKQEEFEMQ